MSKRAEKVAEGETFSQEPTKDVRRMAMIKAEMKVRMTTSGRGLPSVTRRDVEMRKDESIKPSKTISKT